MHDLREYKDIAATDVAVNYIRLLNSLLMRYYKSMSGMTVE